MINQKSSSKISSFLKPRTATDTEVFAMRDKSKPPARNAFRHGRNAGGRKRWVSFLVISLLFCSLLFFNNIIYAAPSGSPPPPGTTKTDVTAQGWTWPSSWTGMDKIPKDLSYYMSFLAQNGIKGTDQDPIIKKLQNDGLLPTSFLPNLTKEETIASEAQGKQALSGALGDAALVPVIGILRLIAAFCKKFMMFGAWVLDATLDPSLYNFTGSDFIKKGWITVRDVCNLFFLLALLFIAFCTILKIEKYHARKTLLMLIIMALLINFSKPIAVFIFDGSQLLMNFFLVKLTGGNQTASTMYSQASQIAKIVYNDQSFPLLGGTDIAINLLFVIVFLFMYAVALLVLAIFLIIRIIAIMLLIIVSPFAFFASVIPDFNKMSSSWWDALFKYSFYGPAAAFFLLLGTGLASALPQFKLQPGTEIDGGIIRSMVRYLTVLVFLYASIIMANKFSLQFSKAITDRADKIMKWAGGMTKTGGMWGWGSKRLGVTGGVSQALQQIPYLRTLTKAGRQKGQEEKEAWIAGKLGVGEAEFKNLQKRSKEKYKDADSKSVIARAEAGDMEAFLEAADRGDADSLKMLSDPKILNGIRKIPGLRDHIRHLYRKNDQAQFAATLQTLIPDDNRAGFSEIDNAKFYADKELKRLNTNKLANVDWADFATNKNQVPERFLPIYKETLQQRISDIAETNPTRFMELASELKGANMNFLKTEAGFRDILANAKGRRGEELDQRDAMH